MFQDVEKYVDFIIKNKLTQAQFLYLYLLRRKSFDVIKKYKEAFPTPDGSMIGKDNRQDLINKGFIEKIGEGEMVSDYRITDKFNHLFLKNHFVAADEIWSLYPAFTRINGNNIPLLNMDKYAFSNMYAERIDYSVHEHLQVVQDIKFGRENNLIKSNIENFTRSESWSKIREIRLGQVKVEEQREDLSF